MLLTAHAWDTDQDDYGWFSITAHPEEIESSYFQITIGEIIASTNIDGPHRDNTVHRLAIGLE